MSLWNVVVLCAVITGVCCQLQIPTRLQDVQHIFRDIHRSFTNYSFAPENFGESADVGDSPCLTKLKTLAKGLSTLTNQESIAFFDAAGKPVPGITQGNLLMMGDYDMCMKIKNDSKGYYDYCFIGLPAKLFGFPVEVDWSGCLPYECRLGNEADVIQWINSLLPSGVFSLGTGSLICTETIKFDAGAIAASVYLGLVAFLVVAGTFWYECRPVIRSVLERTPEEDTAVLVNCEENVYDEIAQETTPGQTNKPPSPAEPEQVDSLLTRIFDCFALQRSFSVLTNTETKPGQILCLNGIRVISINWIVLGHTYLVFSRLIGDKYYLGTLINRKNVPIILNAFPAVDTFFTMSGFLVAYLLLKQLARSGGPINMGVSKWVAFYVHRYVRLTAPYLMVILVEGFLYRQWVTGPLEFGLDPFNKACKDYWYTNVLYINNLVPWNNTECCIGQSWYLANDMQFYVIAPIFVILLFWRPLAGVLVTNGVVICSAVTTAIITYHYKLGPTSAANSNQAYDWLLYKKPWIRIRPYQIGILGGWIYWKYGQAFQDRVKRLSEWKKLVFAGPLWAATCAIQWAVVFGLYDDIKKFDLDHIEPSVADSVSYEIFDRIAWPLTLVIQIYLCQCGLGRFINSILSWRGWVVLARLTYSVYLLHIGLISVLLVMMRHPVYFHPDYEMGVLYLGCLMMSYLAAAVLYVCVEQPLASLETLIYRK